MFLRFKSGQDSASHVAATQPLMLERKEEKEDETRSDGTMDDREEYLRRPGSAVCVCVCVCVYVCVCLCVCLITYIDVCVCVFVRVFS